MTPATDTRAIIANAIHQIQIPVVSLDFIVEGFLHSCDDLALRAEFSAENMRAHARKAAADVTIATTFAQIFERSDHFNDVLSAVNFGDVPNDLIATFKEFLIDKALGAPGIVTDLPPAQVTARFAVMRQMLH